MPKPEEYLMKVAEIMRVYGVRGLTMDQIALQMGVTKRTLYNNFGTKEELLNTMITYFIEQTREQLLVIASCSSKNAVAIQCEMFMQALRDDRRMSILFWRSLRECYPDIFVSMTDQVERLMQEFFALNVPRGRTEGLYRTDFDIDIVATFAFRVLNELANDIMINNAEIDPKKLKYEMFTFLIRGMLSVHGVELFEAEAIKLKQELSTLPI